MFFIASKVFWFFLTPSDLLPLLVLIGLVLIGFGRRRTGLALAASATVLSFVVGLLPVANLVIRPLENRFPPYRDDGRPVAGIVLLGGVVQSRETLARGQLVLNEAAERLVATVDLARRYPQAKILLSGGSGALTYDEVPEMDVVADYLVGNGIPRDRLVIENRSRTTAENAAMSRDLAQPKPGETWLLVTSAWHMPRSVGVFRQAGFPVRAYPVDYRTDGEAGWEQTFVSVSEGQRRLDLATKEWMGLIAYRLSGRTGSVLPAP